MVGVQVIDRHGQRAEINTFNGNRAQISYNSDGHVVIRLIDYNTHDILFVLDKETSNTMIKFCKNITNVDELTDLYKQFKKADNEIPF